MDENKKQPYALVVNSPQSLVATTAVITTTVLGTTLAWNVVGELVKPPLTRLTRRLKKENEKN